MADLPSTFWLAFVLIAGATVLAMLHVCAAVFGRARQVHDLKARVSDLRNAYAQRMANLAEESGQERMTIAEAKRASDRAAAEAAESVRVRHAA